MLILLVACIFLGDIANSSHSMKIWGFTIKAWNSRLIGIHYLFGLHILNFTQLSEPAQKCLRVIKYKLSKKAESQKRPETLRRRARTLDAIFDQGRKTLLLLDFYAAVLPQLKEFIIMFQVKVT